MYERIHFMKMKSKMWWYKKTPHILLLRDARTLCALSFVQHAHLETSPRRLSSLGEASSSFCVEAFCCVRENDDAVFPRSSIQRR